MEGGASGEKVEAGFGEIEVETQEPTSGEKKVESVGEEGWRVGAEEDVVHVGVDGGRWVGGEFVAKGEKDEVGVKTKEEGRKGTALA